MWIMIAGPYRTGSSDARVWARNLGELNKAAYAVFQKGHVPIVAVNLALPIIERAGENEYAHIMMPLALNLTERCDAVLRIDVPSAGADEEVERFRARDLQVYRSIDEIPEGVPLWMRPP